MPTEDRQLYSRGKYRLEWDRRKDGTLRSPFLQIIWYDDVAGRNRSKTTGTAEIRAAEDELDRLWLLLERGQSVCPTCGRPMDQAGSYLLTTAIADYLLAREKRSSIESLRARLAHVLDFLDHTHRSAITCEQISDEFVDEFRLWSSTVPVIEGTVNPKVRERAPGTIEASVRTLAAAINFAHNRKDTLFPARFTVLAPRDVSRTPTYRSSIEELADMFRYCVAPQPPEGEIWSDKMIARQRQYRENLLRFLQVSVATWCRPDAAHDVSTAAGRDQWISNARVLQLNPRGRRQTKKYRPALPVAYRFARILDATKGFFVTVKSVRKAFEAMLDDLGLPRERETGLKLIRRSVSQIARPRIGEAQWRQGEIMLGHAKISTSDIYALFDPANLGVALTVTEGIIEEIETLCPGAFAVPLTGETPEQPPPERAGIAPK